MRASSLQQTPRVKFRYANILRCIGQSLESVDLKAIELKRQGDTYVVQAWHRGTSSSMNFERQYSLSDIKKLEIEGKEKRRPFPGPMNLLSLSQVLRLAGNYVDRAYGRLVRISWQDQSDKIQSITVQYEPFESEQSGDAQSITIDEICLHVYKQRKKIAGGADKHFHRAVVTSTAESEPAKPPVAPRAG